jgi:hypothetical protein
MLVKLNQIISKDYQRIKRYQMKACSQYECDQHVEMVSIVFVDSAKKFWIINENIVDKLCIDAIIRINM